MPRVCTVCAHPDRDAMDRALVGNAAYRPLAALYRVSPDAVARHAAKHLPATLALAQAAEDVARSGDLLSQLRALQQRTLAVLTQAEESGRLTPAVLAIGQARQNIELLAKLLGELDERPQVNLIVSPEWLAVRGVLFEALVPYPEARAAVAGRLLTLEAADGPR